MLTAALRFYTGELRRSPKAKAYLASRRIDGESAVHLGLGYAPGTGLRAYLESVGFTGQRIRESGLFLEHGAERFAGMIVVPDLAHGLAHGLARWLTGRAVDAGAKPRFQAVPGPKPVLGLARLGPAPEFAILTEGVFDYLTLAAWGYPAVAALGTQGMDKVATALRGCPRIFLAFDSDDPGNTAARQLQELLGNRAAVVDLPDCVADVGELATRPQRPTPLQPTCWRTQPTPPARQLSTSSFSLPARLPRRAFPFPLNSRSRRSQSGPADGLPSRRAASTIQHGIQHKAKEQRNGQRQQ